MPPAPKINRQKLFKTQPLHDERWVREITPSPSLLLPTWLYVYDYCDKWASACLFCWMLDAAAQTKFNKFFKFVSLTRYILQFHFSILKNAAQRRLGYGAEIPWMALKKRYRIIFIHCVTLKWMRKEEKVDEIFGCWLAVCFIFAFPPLFSIENSEGTRQDLKLAWVFFC